MESNKPAKIPYDDQSEAYAFIVSQLTVLLQDYSFVKDAFIWGSLANGSFGTYVEPYKDETGSDIDFILVVDESLFSTIPSNWKNTGVSKSWFDLHYLGYISYKNTRHRIDGLVVFPSKHNVSRMLERISGTSKKIY